MLIIMKYGNIEFFLEYALNLETLWCCDIFKVDAANLDEVQKVCTHFCVLNKGNLIYSGVVEELSREKNRFQLKAENSTALKSALESSNQISEWKEDDLFFSALIKDLISK